MKSFPFGAKMSESCRNVSHPVNTEEFYKPSPTHQSARDDVTGVNVCMIPKMKKVTGICCHFIFFPSFEKGWKMFDIYQNALNTTRTTGTFHRLNCSFLSTILLWKAKEKLWKSHSYRKIQTARLFSPLDTPHAQSTNVEKVPAVGVTRVYNLSPLLNKESFRGDLKQKQEGKEPKKSTEIFFRVLRFGGARKGRTVLSFTRSRLPPAPFGPNVYANTWTCVNVFVCVTWTWKLACVTLSNPAPQEVLVIGLYFLRRVHCPVE